MPVSTRKGRVGNGWPRERIAKDEPQWEVNDKVDVYIESVYSFWLSQV